MLSSTKNQKKHPTRILSRKPTVVQNTEEYAHFLQSQIGKDNSSPLTQKIFFISVPNTSEIPSIHVRNLDGREVVIKIWKRGFLLIGGWLYVCVDHYIIGVGWLKY